MAARPGLWDNIRKKKARIAAGSGERMRKPGSKGAPTATALKRSQSKRRAQYQWWTNGGINRLNLYKIWISSALSRRRQGFESPWGRHKIKDLAKS